MTRTLERPPTWGARRSRIGRFFCAALLIAAVAACSSKSPAQVASTELAAGLVSDQAGNTADAVTH